jgi:hypothetical protein
MDIKQDQSAKSGVDLSDASIERGMGVGIGSEPQVSADPIVAISVSSAVIAESFSTGLRDFQLSPDELTALLDQPDVSGSIAELNALAIAPAVQLFALLASERPDGSPLNSQQDRVNYAIELSEADEIGSGALRYQTRLAAIAALGDRIPSGQALAVSYISAANSVSIDAASQFCERREHPIANIFEVPEVLSLEDKALLALMSNGGIDALANAPTDNSIAAYKNGRAVTIPGLEGTYKVADRQGGELLVTPTEGGYSFRVEAAELREANPLTFTERARSFVENTTMRARELGLLA